MKLLAALRLLMFASCTFVLISQGHALFSISVAVPVDAAWRSFLQPNTVVTSTSIIVEGNAAPQTLAATRTSIIVDQNKEPSEPFIFVRPTGKNTLITMISMFKSPKKTLLVERCIRSIRKSGRFTGYIMVLTDPRGFKRYNYTMSWDPKTIVMSGLQEDLKPINATIVQRKNMIAKRFKTLAVKYLEFDKRLAARTRYILYMDIDNVVANRLQPFFDDYYSLLLMRHQNSHGNLTDSSYFFAYRDPGYQKNTSWHGGLAMHHREHSIRCLDGWRREMDRQRFGYDQVLLLRVLNNFPRHNCVLHSLPDGHFELASRRNMRPKPPINMTTIVHITNTGRAKTIPHNLQARFVRRALKLLQDNETMVGNITWNEVLSVQTF
jgi:hypothetical protein